MDCPDCPGLEALEVTYKGLVPKEVSFHISKLNGEDKIALHITAENGQLMFFNTNAQPEYITMLSDPRFINVVFPALKDLTFVRKE